MADPMDDIRAELFGEMTIEQQVKKVFNDHVLLAAATIVDLATNSPNERIRLQAAESVVTRVCGPAGRDEAGDTLLDFLKAIQS